MDKEKIEKEIRWLATVDATYGLPPLDENPPDGLGHCRLRTLDIRYEARSLAFSPAGGWLAVGTKAGEAYLIATRSGEGAKLPLPELNHAIRWLHFLDERTLVCLYFEGAAAGWYLPEGLAQPGPGDWRQLTSSRRWLSSRTSADRRGILKACIAAKSTRSLVGRPALPPLNRPLATSASRSMSSERSKARSFDHQAWGRKPIATVVHGSKIVGLTQGKRHHHVEVVGDHIGQTKGPSNDVALKWARHGVLRLPSIGVSGALVALADSRGRVAVVRKKTWDAGPTVLNEPDAGLQIFWAEGLGGGSGILVQFYGDTRLWTIGAADRGTIWQEWDATHERPTPKATRHPRICPEGDRGTCLLVRAHSPLADELAHEDGTPPLAQAWLAWTTTEGKVWLAGLPDINVVRRRLLDRVDELCKGPDCPVPPALLNHAATALFAARLMLYQVASYSPKWLPEGSLPKEPRFRETFGALFRAFKKPEILAFCVSFHLGTTPQVDGVLECVLCLLERAVEVDQRSDRLVVDVANRLVRNLKWWASRYTGSSNDRPRVVAAANLLNKFVRGATTYLDKTLKLSDLVHINQKAGRMLDAAVYQGRLRRQGYDVEARTSIPTPPKGPASAIHPIGWTQEGGCFRSCWAAARVGGRNVWIVPVEVNRVRSLQVHFDDLAQPPVALDGVAGLIVDGVVELFRAQDQHHMVFLVACRVAGGDSTGQALPFRELHITATSARLAAPASDKRSQEPEHLPPTIRPEDGLPVRAMAVHVARPLDTPVVGLCGSMELDGRVIVWVAFEGGQVRAYEGNRWVAWPEPPESTWATSTTLGWQFMTPEQALSTRAREDKSITDRTLDPEIWAPRVYADDATIELVGEDSLGWVEARRPNQDKEGKVPDFHEIGVAEVRGDPGKSAFHRFEEGDEKTKDKRKPFWVVLTRKADGRGRLNIDPTKLVGDEVELIHVLDRQGPLKVRRQYLAPSSMLSRFIDTRPFAVGGELQALAVSTHHESPLLAWSTRSGHLVVRRLEHFTDPQREPDAVLLAAQELSPVIYLHFLKVGGSQLLLSLTREGRMALYDVSEPGGPGRWPGRRLDYRLINQRVASAHHVPVTTSNAREVEEDGVVEAKGVRLQASGGWGKLEVAAEDGSVLSLDLSYCQLPSPSPTMEDFWSVYQANPDYNCLSSAGGVRFAWGEAGDEIDTLSGGDRFARLVATLMDVIWEEPVRGDPAVVLEELGKRWRYPPRARMKQFWLKVAETWDEDLKKGRSSFDGERLLKIEQQITREWLINSPGVSIGILMSSTKRILERQAIARSVLTDHQSPARDHLFERLQDDDPVVALEALHALNVGLTAAWLDSGFEARAAGDAERQTCHEITRRVAVRCKRLHASEPLFFELARFCGLFLCLYPNNAVLVGLVLSETNVVDRHAEVARDVAQQARLLAWFRRRAVNEADYSVRVAQEAAKRLESYLRGAPFPPGLVKVTDWDDGDLIQQQAKLAELMEKLEKPTTEDLDFTDPPPVFKHSFALGKALYGIWRWFDEERVREKNPASSDWYAHVTIEAARWWLKHRGDVFEPQRSRWAQVIKKWADALRDRREHGRQLIELMGSFDRHRQQREAEQLTAAVFRVAVENLRDWPFSERSDLPRATSVRGTIRRVVAHGSPTSVHELMETAFATVDNARISSALLSAALAAVRPEKAKESSSMRSGTVIRMLRDLVTSKMWRLDVEDMRDLPVPGREDAWLAMLVEVVNNFEKHPKGAPKPVSEVRCALTTNSERVRFIISSDREVPAVGEAIRKAASSASASQGEAISKAASSAPASQKEPQDGVPRSQGLRMVLELWRLCTKDGSVRAAWALATEPLPRIVATKGTSEDGSPAADSLRFSISLGELTDDKPPEGTDCFALVWEWPAK